MKIILILLFLFVYSVDSNGQRFIRKYGATSINELTKSQLEESSVNARKTSNLGAGCVLVGAICLPAGGIFLHRANHPVDGGFLAGLDDGIRAAGFFAAGVVTIIPGSILIISSNHRKKLIQPVLDNFKKDQGSLGVSPVIIFNGSSQDYLPGFTVTLKF